MEVRACVIWTLFYLHWTTATSPAIDWVFACAPADRHPAAMFVAAISSMLLGVAGAPIELLKRIPLFSDLNGRELRAVADSMRERTFEAGSSVLQEGKSGVGFFVVEAGKARVSIGGRETNVLGAGDYFGEIAVIGGVDRTATITAESDLHCYGMTPWDFRPLVASNASIAWKLLQALARRVSVAEQGRD